MEFKTIQDNVEYILMHHPETRDSDKKLYVKVVERMNPEAIDKPFKEAMLADLPSFETVRRTRQKLQEKQTWLRPSPAVQDFRTGLEEEYRKYAIDN